MGDPRPRYCFDTSSLMEPWNHRYPIGSFPTFWQKIDLLIEEDRMLAIDEVREEIARIDDGLKGWCKERGRVFMPLSTVVQLEAKRVLREFPRLTDTVKGRGKADPFVIALASLTGTVVVTEEAGSLKNPKIPEVCYAWKINCTNVLGLIRTEGWSF
ncbi:DUF4411 family protein [Sorangium sp. So ce1389]|uniref:DUF4411 family protein n=1 Tax=Sorangium sp. So ce1389 TaxID=3133336 RepID=UPI003F6112A2